MVHIYEKVCKTKDNVYGMREIFDENLFKNGPCIITILAGPIFLENINGSLRQVSNLVNPDIDNNYDPNRRILGFGDYNEKYEKEKEFADTIATKQILINNGGHLNAESGYTEFEELLKYV